MRESAGILLFRSARRGDSVAGGRHSPGSIEMLLVHPGGPFWAKKDMGAWSIPKGECEEGEDPRKCALRELAEELGAATPALARGSLIDLGSVRQKAGKVVHAWAAEGDFDPAGLRSNTFTIEWPPRSGARQEFPEVDRAEWFGPDEARAKIIPAQAAFVDRLLEYLG
jgi:predicted NUDIX family NTP pyrophosphohydrolase